MVFETISLPIPSTYWISDQIHCTPGITKFSFLSISFNTLGTNPLISLTWLRVEWAITWELRSNWRRALQNWVPQQTKSNHMWAWFSWDWLQHCTPLGSCFHCIRSEPIIFMIQTYTNVTTINKTKTMNLKKGCVWGYLGGFWERKGKVERIQLYYLKNKIIFNYENNNNKNN